MILHSLRYVSSTVPEVTFDTARGIFLPCSRYASTMLEVRFDRAPGMFPRCSRYISTVLDVGFDVLMVFLTVVDVSLHRARDMF